MVRIPSTCSCHIVVEGHWRSPPQDLYPHDIVDHIDNRIDGDPEQEGAGITLQITLVSEVTPIGTFD